MQTATPERRTAAGRIDVTDLPLDRLREYARARGDGDVHLERRGGRAYLVA
ncbi:MAG: hypothetical protein ABEH77_10660 [Halobacteriaceae archaeon]